MSLETKNARSRVQTMVRIALFAAVTAILSQISFMLPFGIPLTLQTFAVALCGYTLGKRDGTIAILVYVLLGAVGVPVFAGFAGGFHKIVGLTGGFIVGFLPFSFLAGLGKEKKTVWALVLGTLGVLACHACGVVQYAVLSGISLEKSFFTISSAFLAKDIISIAAAYAVSLPINRAVSRF